MYNDEGSVNTHDGVDISVNADSLWKQISEATTLEERTALREAILQAGYGLFYDCLELIKASIKQYEDADAERIAQHLKQAEAVIPDPGTISPSWSDIWDKYRQMVAAKNEVLHRIARNEREGEWQVILDNPYSNDPIVCYPHLSFLEGAYLYSYFRADLMKNEYVRLQKIVTLVQSEN